MGKIAMDFGTSNTLIASYNEATGQVDVISYPEFSREYRYRMNGHESSINVVPSLIHYGDEREYLGNQVCSQGLLDKQGTFRWMKRFINGRKRYPRSVNGKSVSDFDAGKRFISSLLLFSREHFNPEEDEIIVTVPVEAYEHYTDWLAQTLSEEPVGARRFRILDEPAACAMGYRLHIRTQDPFMVFDFGGGTLDVCIARINLKETGHQKSEVLGKSGYEIGGLDIDQWLFEDLLMKNNLNAPQVANVSNEILSQLEKIKEDLSITKEEDEKKAISIFDYDTGRTITGAYSRRDLEDILERHNLRTTIHEVIDDAMDTAIQRGIKRKDIARVLMVGGSSLIPYVQRCLIDHFGGRVCCENPFDAIARGACYYLGGDIDFIRHEYALRYFNAEKSRHEFRTLIPSCTNYPTEEEFVTLSLKGVCDGQVAFNLAIYELGLLRIKKTVIEVDEFGRYQLGEEGSGTGHFWINEKCPTMLKADPPVSKGEVRYKLTFFVDGNRRLCVTAFDLRSREYVYKKHPVIKLT
ncbi:Hsp70 family protein [bacterium]|nr:Hsp70 family protein [bacterium]